MAKVILFIALSALFCLKLILTAELETGSNYPQSRKRSVSDPVSNFFSELGDVFLDIDRTMSVQTAPKVNFEERVASQLLGPFQPRKEYFERIQDNYKNLQDRLGSIISDAISPRQNTVGRRIDPLTSILLPDMKSESKKDESSKSLTDVRQGAKQSQSLKPLSPEEQMRATVERILADTKRTGEFLGSLETLKPLRAASSLLTRRSGDVLESGDSSDPQGKTGDSLYSESRFDQYIRQLLQNHGRWVLDNPLFKGWQSSSRNTVVETHVEPLSKETEEVFTTESTTTETIQPMKKSENEIPNSPVESFERLSDPVPFSANYYEISNDGEIINEVDIVLQPETIPETVDEVSAEDIEETEQEIERNVEEIEEELEPRDTVILAFTSDGVPLKLRMGPEIVNPVKFLHRVLRKAGATLKVPVESYEDLEPVGKEVLLLGAGSGILTRAVYLDLSNPNELRSLLRTLAKLKTAEKIKY